MRTSAASVVSSRTRVAAALNFDGFGAGRGAWVRLFAQMAESARADPATR
jgi:hypothetical protein